MVSKIDLRIPAEDGLELGAWLFLLEGSASSPAITMAQGVAGIKELYWPTTIRKVLQMKCVAIAVLVALTSFLGGPASAEQNEAEARDLFTRFVAAQNAHDPNQVKSLLWNSPQMLFFSRGIETRGAEAVAARFKEYYEGTWHLEPDMSKFHVAVISKDVVQILVPIVFTRGLPGTQQQSDTFLISQTFIKDEHGWQVASILPIANTQLKR